MVVVSYSGKEINAKLVYYGAGLSGKTTNLESIYEAVPDTSRGKMVSMKTQSDRTLFFDLLPLDLGEIMGFKTRFLLYTVPGQVFYNATRKLVLKGADAIVFVADSEVGKMEENRESLQNLRDNLAEYKLSLDEIPWVIQYNKRDLPNVYTLDELNAEMNPGGKVPFFEAVATQGKGVFETFRGISHLLMEKVTKDLRRGPGHPSPTREAVKPEEPKAAAPVAPSAPPMLGSTSHPAAPVPAASAPPARVAEPAAAHGESGLDYGRQIDLNDARPAPEPVRATRPPADAPAVPRFTTVSAETVATVAPAMPQRDVTAPSIRTEAVVEANADPATGAASIVVPVTLPARGETQEIVIRIVLKQAA